MERAPAGESARRWRESERGARSSGGVTGRRTEPPARGRPQVATLEDQGQLSRKGAVRTSRPRARHPPTLPSFDIYCEPGGPDQTGTLAHPALPLGKAPRFLGSGPQTTLPARGLEAGSSGCTVLYFFGSRTLLVSLFCIKKKQIKYVFVFTVYLLYSSYPGLDIFIFLRGGWAE